MTLLMFWLKQNGKEGGAFLWVRKNKLDDVIYFPCSFDIYLSQNQGLFHGDCFLSKTKAFGKHVNRMGINSRSLVYLGKTECLHETTETFSFNGAEEVRRNKPKTVIFIFPLI